MTTCLIIGAKGFIGSAITAEAVARGYAVTAVDLDNYDTARGAAFDLLINAAGNSRKFIDDQDPIKGYELSVASVMSALQDFRFSYYVQLSSGAVYPDEGSPRNNTEDTVLTPERMSRYGFHKWLAEQLVRHYAPRHLIVRMGGFVGPGLRKNAVFDLLSGGNLFVHPDSEFQYMDTRTLAKSVFELYEKASDSPRLLNLSAQGTVSVRLIAEWAGVDLPPELNVETAASLIALPQSLHTVRDFISAFRNREVFLG
jgi:nucleoside-diphosphate-sugar epimerase